MDRGVVIPFPSHPRHSGDSGEKELYLSGLVGFVPKQAFTRMSGYLGIDICMSDCRFQRLLEEEDDSVADVPAGVAHVIPVDSNPQEAYRELCGRPVSFGMLAQSLIRLDLGLETAPDAFLAPVQCRYRVQPIYAMHIDEHAWGLFGEDAYARPIRCSHAIVA